MAAWAERLRPRSTEGDVYRDEWVEQFELIFDGGGVLITSLSAVSFVVNGEWLWGAGFLILIAAMIVVAVWCSSDRISSWAMTCWYWLAYSARDASPSLKCVG